MFINNYTETFALQSTRNFLCVFDTAYRVQNSLRRVDPEGSLARQLSMHVLRRRAYRVPAPNSLWHIDGNHKLIRLVFFTFLFFLFNLLSQLVLLLYFIRNSATYVLFYFCRWRIVIHAGVDGFSRLIVFIAAATNNKATTVLDNFLSAVGRYGLPSRVRSDKVM